MGGAFGVVVLLRRLSVHLLFEGHQLEVGVECRRTFGSLSTFGTLKDASVDAILFVVVLENGLLTELDGVDVERCSLLLEAAIALLLLVTPEAVVDDDKEGTARS